jgi:acetyl esterase/lipase
MFYSSSIRLMIVLIACIALFRCASTNQPDPEGDTTNPVDTIANPFPDTTGFDIVKINLRDSILGNSVRFDSIDLFTDAALENKTGVYSQANDFTGKNISLDFSFLAPADDTLKKRPFVLFVHEGAFLYGTLDNEMEKARSLAHKGFATASINYRLGFNGGSETNICGSSRQELIRTIYRAVQDTYAALFYFTNNAETLGIDVSQIFLAGSSAGAITVSSLAYMKESDFKALDPEIVKVLGPLDPYQTTKRFKLRALLTSLGYGLISSSTVSAASARPTIFFQRTEDNILPYQQGPLFFCSSYPVIYGAKGQSDKLKVLKIPFELNYEPEKGHLLSYPEDYISKRYAMFVKRFWKKDNRQIVLERYQVVSDVKTD